MEEYIKENLDYNPETGVFRWKIMSKGRKESVGYSDKGPWGYSQIVLNRKKFLAHRLAWFLYYGVFPDGVIDHINGDKQDNRIANLRIASLSDNQCNRTAQSNSSTGIKGVRKAYGERFSSSIQKDGKEIYLGTFNTLEDAATAYEAAAKELHKDFYRK